MDKENGDSILFTKNFKRIFITFSQNDMVVIEMTGDRQVLGVHINSQIIDPNDSELLEDLIYVALKDALNKVEELNAKKLGPLSGGLL